MVKSQLCRIVGMLLVFGLATPALGSRKKSDRRRRATKVVLEQPMQNITEIISTPVKKVIAVAVGMGSSGLCIAKIMAAKALVNLARQHSLSDTYDSIDDANIITAQLDICVGLAAFYVAGMSGLYVSEL